MKTLKIASLSMLLSLVGFASHPGTSEAKKPSPRVGKAVKRAIRSLPDLRCRVRVWEDAAGTKPVTNGGTLGYGGGNPKLYAQVIIENTGSVDAAAAASTVSIKRHGGQVAGYNETLTIPAGLAKIYPTVRIDLPSITNPIAIDVNVDTGSAVRERSELNNTCSFSTTVSVVH